MRDPKDAPIGLCDSGWGGLSVYQSVVKLLPEENYVYIGDHAYLPYGDRKAGQIRSRIVTMIRWLVMNKHVKLVIVACNSGTVAGISEYRALFPGVPIIGVVPVVKLAAEVSKKKSFAVLSTPFTAASQYQKKLINLYAPACKVYNIGCPDLVHAVEAGVNDLKHVQRIVCTHLTPEVRSSIDVLALGCTHYPFLRPVLASIVGSKVVILDSGDAVARQVQRVLVANKLLRSHGSSALEVYTTEQSVSQQNIASSLLQHTIKIQYECL